MKPLILISNDDSITAKGIRHLVNIAKQFGDVLVVSPHSPQSAQSHAITIAQPLRLYKSTQFGDDVMAYSCTGTPVDCIKLAHHHLLTATQLNRKPDLVLSGINHGSNSSISVIYSGTMGAAMEAAISNIPALAFSVCDYDHHGELNHTTEIISGLIGQVLQKGMPAYTAFNVNLPKDNGTPIKGLKVCRQAKAKWQEKFDERQDPYNGQYFWMAGEFKSLDTGTDTDEYALSKHYASLVPCHFDMTNYAQLDAAKVFEV